MDEKDKNALVDAVLAAAVKEGERMQLACAEAHRIADRFGVDRRLVGQICNERGIRVVACQLGLFP